MTTDPALIERMKRHFRAVAEAHPKSIDPLAVEARTILALLPDPDLEAAREIAAQYDRPSSMSHKAWVDCALDGILHGRANPA